MAFSDLELEVLLSQKAITDDWPWDSDNERTVHLTVEKHIWDIAEKYRLLDKTEYNHYGSGYASFVDCFLYRNDDDFRFDAGNCFWGLVVLFSRLSHYFVIGEGQKTWQPKASSSYLPSFEFVDVFTHDATQALAKGVSQLLETAGLVRLHSSDLSEMLPSEYRVPTILADPPWRHFDALFYWED